MKNKKIITYFAIIAVLITGIIFTQGKITGGSIMDDDVQTITIGMDNWVYSPSYIKVKAGVPVEIRLDDSVSGCFRDLIIPELNIRKYMTSSKDIIKVTFEKGEYTFACSMFMGQGKIIAE